jgi:gliding motility-associated-like protein
VYTVQGAAPCPAAIASVNVTVIQPPNAGGDGQVILCFNASAVDLFTALSNNPGTGGNWTDPIGAASNGTIVPATDAEGIYTYTVQGTAPCPDDQSLVEVIVGDPISATVIATDAVCHDACDGTAALSIVGGTPDYTMQWSANAAGNAAMTATGLCAGNYSVNVTDAGGCTGSSTYVINEPPPLVIDGLSAMDENCISSCDGSVTVNDAAGVLFSIDGGATWSPSPTLGQLCAGDYTVMMQDANGCLASAPATILSPDPVLAAFYASPDTTSVSNSLVVFTNQTANAETFVWDFAGLGSSTDGNPSFAFPDVLGGTYTVCLTAINSNGCMDTVCHPVVVLDELFVNVPNAFTPNGDGINEGFCPIFNDPALAADYTFMIFDRWGLLIFESTTIHEKWNAKLNSVDVPEDVYVWKMHCRDIITKEVYDRIGHVTVVR